MLFQNWTSPLYWISLFGIFLYIYYTIYGNAFQLELVTILNCFMCAKGQKRTAEAVLRVPENCRMVRPTNATNGGRPQVAPTQKRFVRCCPNLQNNISEVLFWISHRWYLQLLLLWIQIRKVSEILLLLCSCYLPPVILWRCFYSPFL